MTLALKALRVLIVDDEPLARARLKTLLADIEMQLPSIVVGEAGNGVEALSVWPASQAEVLLVDIRMPRMDGLELARHLASCVDPPAVIFTTAYDAHAIEAFEVSAIDYLLKPIRAERLLNALEKAAARRSSGDHAALGEAGALSDGARHHFSCLELGRLLLVPVDSVLYLKADQKYVAAGTSTREYLLDESLAKLEEEFSSTFIRVHRGTLVARDAIVGFERVSAADAGEGDHWEVLLRDCELRFPVSRRQWPLVKDFAKHA